jgi:hypothetical protein
MTLLRLNALEPKEIAILKWELRVGRSSLVVGR